MCTVEKRGDIFILTLTGSDSDEHRLNPTLIASIRSAISDIKSQSSATTPSALITTATGKFFSNGFDLRWAQSSGDFFKRLRHMVESFKPVVSDLISLPMPTIAAVPGHAAAAGFVLALSHDYVLMRKDRGVLYMSEIDIGMTFPEYFNVLFSEKLGSAMVRRDVLLRGARLKGVEAARLGIVDSAIEGGPEEVVAAAVRLGEELVGRKWNGEVYAEIRKGLYPQLCRELGLSSKPVVVSRL